MDYFDSDHFGHPDFEIAGFQLWVHDQKTQDFGAHRKFEILNVTIQSVKAGLKTTVQGWILPSSDIISFRDQLNSLIARRRNKAELILLDPDKMKIELSSLKERAVTGCAGFRVKVRINIKQNVDPQEFVFDTDEIQIRAAAAQVNEIVNKFRITAVENPVRGTVRGKTYFAFDRKQDEGRTLFPRIRFPKWLFSICLFCGAFTISTLNLIDRIDDDRILDTGTRTTAIVQSKEQHSTAKSPHHYYVTYEFRDGLGNSFIAKGEVPYEWYSNLEKGSPIEIVYDSTRALPAGWNRTSIFDIVFPLLFFIALGLLFWPWKKPLRLSRETTQPINF